MDFLNIIKIIFASIFVLFLPGFCVSFIFFDKGKIDLIERIALSFALSISLVPLLAFYLNLLGIPIRAQSVIVEVLMIIFLALLCLILQGKIPSHFMKETIKKL